MSHSSSRRVLTTVAQTNYRSTRVRFTLAFLICASLLTSSVVLTQSASGHSAPQSRMGHPEAGAPVGTWPDLDQIRGKPHPAPHTPDAPRSLIRGRRKPLQPRAGRKVGDPGTDRVATIGKPSKTMVGYAEAQPPTASSHIAARGLHHALNLSAGLKRGLSRPVPPVTGDDYLQGWFSTALNRSATTTEAAYWSDILKAAYSHGQSSMVLSVRELGKTLFESSDYAARNRSNQDYVSDLYHTYLLRSPDSGGWSYWEGQVPLIGRENVRRAFDECGEFVSDVATVSVSGSASSTVTSAVTARVDLVNQSGNQLLPRDAEWSLPIVSLAGRGLDLGLSLSYSSSAVWTRSGPYIYFDDDNSSLSPGFRLGFPTVQELFFNAETGQNSYLLITSAGSRTELRQVGSTNVYEAADSSHLQLTDNSASSPSRLLLRPADGAQMSYTKIENEWRCIEIKDRNGNYLTINYNSLGDLTSVVDTLGRTLSFVYDSNANLTEIDQTWHRDLQTGGQSNETHKWATFGWGTTTIQPGFSGISMSGIANGQSIPVLTMVGLPDQTYYKFTYTSSNLGQVARITHYASDSNPATDYHERAHTNFTYNATDDVTRLTDTRESAENWTGINSVPSEVITQYGYDNNNAYWLVTSDGTVYKEFYGFGWQKRLVQQTQTWSADGTEQKWTSTAWTQDNTSVGYLLNPRITETNIYDASGNRRRTGYDYVTTFNLPQCVIDYAADATTVIRYTCRGYNEDSAYISRRIIGLPAVDNVFDGNWTYFSKTTYSYDWHTGYMSTDAPSVQHDTTNYGSTFDVGRAVLTGVKRYNINYPSDDNQAIWVMQRGYNLAGGTTFTRDAAGHQTNISYGDSFSDSNNSRNTLAYPTQVKDPDWNASAAPNNYATAQYNFDLGALFRDQGPPPKDPSTGNPYTSWSALKRYYDTAGRPEITKNEFNGGYTRYVYGPYYLESYSSVNTAGDDKYVFQTFDGAGRVIGEGSSNPGMTGPYKAQRNVYDDMGRLLKRSNPAEITGSWVTVGDDAAGWLYTTQTYDWKGRPLVTTNPDSTTKTASYGGCGCAGGEVVTLTDEGTIDNGTAKRRQQKVYSDVLGRSWKTEVLNWEGGSVYATTISTYNVRDQDTLIRQYAGDQNSGTYQDTTATYDGYGRLQTKHLSQQSAGTATSYTYNSDDTVASVTDARGASSIYSYNGRHLLTGISYSVPSGSGIAVPASVGFSYDAGGNRASMTDGLGSKTYAYDQLSRLQSESRTFAGVGTFNLSYDYNYASQLKKITDASGIAISYGYDETGQLTAVTGSGTLYAGVSTYASGLKYRAWGGLKQLVDGLGYTVTLGYNARANVNHFDISSGVVNQNYDSYNDGRISVVHNTTDQDFDRAYSYDHAGRLTEGKSGWDVNGSLYIGIPYHETFAYDAFSDLTARGSESWDNFSDTDAATYNNYRRSGWGYDADGRNTTEGSRTNVFDGGGLQTSMSTTAVLLNSSSYTVTQNLAYDADGALLKEVTTQSNAPGYSNTTYHLRSSVLGGAVVEELNSSGQKFVGYVFSPSGAPLAKQSDNAVTWTHYTSASTSLYTKTSGSSATGRTEFDPLGADVAVTAPADPPPTEGEGDIGAGHFAGILDARWSDMFNLDGGCMIDGVASSCGLAMGIVNAGAAVIGPAQTTRWNSRLNNGQGGYQFFHAWANGTQGWSAFGWVPESDPHGQGPAPTLNRKTPVENARDRFIARAAIQKGFDTEDDNDLYESPSYWFLIPQNTKSDCGTFVDQLVALARKQTKGARNLYKVNVGRGMGVGAKNRFGGGHDDPDLKNKTDGFHQYLISGGQGADVYKHIFGIAGGVLIGNRYIGMTVTPQPGARPADIGWEVVYSQLDADKAQLNDPRHKDEAEAEVNDDYAGIDVGKWMGQAIDGTMTQNELREKIFNRLCDH